MRRPLRLLPLGFCALAAACDPVYVRGIALAPQPEAPAPTDSATGSAFALAARVAARYRLKPAGQRREDRREGWVACFERATVWLCGKVLRDEVQFRLTELNPRTRLGFKKPRGSSDVVRRFRRELVDSLRARFGAEQVRECEWREQRDSRRSGCAPPAT